MLRRRDTVVSLSESDLKSQFLLRAPVALPELRLFRRNVGVARAASGNMVRFGIKGLPDLYGLWRGGKYIELELKSKNGRLRPEQAAYAAWCKTWGITHLVLVEASLNPESSIDDWIRQIAATRVT